MKESILNFLNSVVAMPAHAANMISGVLSNPNSLLRYVVAVVILHDILFKSATIVTKLLSVTQENWAGLAIAALVYIVIGNKQPQQ